MRCKNTDCDKEVTRQFHVYCDSCYEKEHDGSFTTILPGSKFKTKESPAKREYLCGLCSKPASAAFGKNTIVIYKNYHSSLLRCQDCAQEVEERSCPQCSKMEKRKLSTLINYKVDPMKVPCSSCKKLQSFEQDLADPEKVLIKFRPGSKFKTKESKVYDLMKDISDTIEGFTKRRDVTFTECSNDNQMIRTVKINRYTGNINGKFMGRGWITGYSRSWNTLLAEYEEYISKSRKFDITRIEIDTWKIIKKTETEYGIRENYNYNYPIIINYHLCLR